MSEAHLHSTTTTYHAVSRDEPSKTATTAPPSFLENFLNSFFQEKNIKWMLVIGAAIVFSSSLMLVTRNWPSWPNTLKYFVILGYTGVIFGAAEVSRKRLGLTSTYKVLHSLTLLLLPVCFLSLQWLSSNSATQVWDAVEFCGLLLPAAAFLWFASSRILDHLLRGRQTTFLLSYCLLSLAGAMPAFHVPVADATATAAEMASVQAAATIVRMQAFAFMAICWVLMTAGIVKVNRYTFWLAEEHRLPRVFGFLPIAMLGLQFILLVGTKAITAIPVHWVGFGLVMTAATVLLTARTVADVFRQRTGDIVRPLPWNIAVPLFTGLVLVMLGLVLSFRGFSYVTQTTYAVIPTSVVAALLMFLAAKDTRHRGFVWAGLACTAIAYQCSPTLFADIVQTLKQSTASAINRQRVPFSLYGVTYLPLLATVTLVSRWFAGRGQSNVALPCKQFVTILAVGLYSIAFTDVVSLFFVSIANAVAFLFFATVFQDRRYIVPSIGAVIVGCGIAIPALNDMQAARIGMEWVSTVLAGVAVLMTATRLPDRILNSIPLAHESIVQHRSADGRLIRRGTFFQLADGSDRALSQFAGVALAGLMAAHWVGFSLAHMTTPMTTAALLQYAFLMSAFVLYTLRNPRYLSGMFFWGMAGFTAFRWAVGLEIDGKEILNAVSFATAAASIFCYLALKWTKQISRSVSLQDLREQLGFLTGKKADEDQTNPASGSGWIRRLQAFVVPLCDLSLVVLACLAAPVHLVLLAGIHLDGFTGGTPLGELLPSTVVSGLWLLAATIVLRSRIAGLASTIVLPLLGTASAYSSGFSLSAGWCLVVWAALEGTVFVLGSAIEKRRGYVEQAQAIRKFSGLLLNGVLIASSVSFAMHMRIAAGICLGMFAVADREALDKSRLTWHAIMANLQVLLFSGGLVGYSGLVSSVFTFAYWPNLLPPIFLAMSISVLLFDKGHHRLDSVTCQTWTTILRAGLVVLSILSLNVELYPYILVIAMAVGFVVVAVSEIAQAVRKQQETYVWTACASLAIGGLFLFCQDIISFGVGISQFVLLGISMTGLVLARVAENNSNLAIIRRPMYTIGQTLPTLVASMAILRQLGGLGTSVTGFNSLALMLAAGIYFHQAITTRKRIFAFMAALIMNAGLTLLWRSMQWNELEFYLVPIGLSILGFVEMLKKELPTKAHDPLRYIGALTILVSPVFDILGGSWGHMFVLMVLSTVVTLLAIGLRIRVLMYTGSAFLLADLIAMVVRSTMDHPSLLWVCGVALGAGVIALAAFCENHRENLLARIRFVTAELATWN